MRNAGPILMGVGVLAGVAALLAANAAEASRPPGQKADVGDDVEVDPASLAGLFSVPAGTTSILLHVTAAGPTQLTGTVTGALVPITDPATGVTSQRVVSLTLPSPLDQGVTVPRASVVAGTHGGSPL